jgi:hypothetical protein
VKKVVEAPKQEKPAERPRPTAWGEREREARDKFRSDSDGMNTSQEDEKERSGESQGRSSEREIILSEKAQQLMSKEDLGPDKPSQRKEEAELPVKDFDKRESKERNDVDKGRDRYGSQKGDGRRDVGGPNNRDRPRQGGRWGSNDNRRDNKTPERDCTVSSGRSSTTDTSVSSLNNSNNKGSSHTDYDLNRNTGIDRSRSGEAIKEGSPGTGEKSSFDGAVNERDSAKSTEYDRSRDRDGNEKRYRGNDDGELDNRGNPKNIRGGRERSGQSVYQPR